MKDTVLQKVHKQFNILIEMHNLFCVLRSRNHMILYVFDNNKLIQSSLYIYEGAVAIGLQVINDLINQNVKGKCIAHKK